MKIAILLAAIAASAALLPVSASAAGLDLTRYTPGYVASTGFKEPSAVAFNYDTGRVLVFHDENSGLEFNPNDGVRSRSHTEVAGWFGPANFFTKDTEALTYIGNNKYVLGDERTMTMAIVEFGPPTKYGQSGNAVQYTFNAPKPEDIYSLSGFVNIGNEGLEGITYDPKTAGYFAVKQTGEVYFVDPKGGPLSGSTHTLLFNAVTLGLASSLNDIQALSIAPMFAGQEFGSNLLLLSTRDHKLIEVTRLGELVSSLSLSIFPPRGPFIDSGYSPVQVEGVTVDFDGNIYVVSERGGRTSAGTIAKLQVAPVPEPATWAMMITGFGIIGAAARRRRSTMAINMA